MKNSVRFAVLLSLSWINSTVLADECKNGAYLVCLGSRMIDILMDRLSQAHMPVVIFPGLEIVSTIGANESDNSMNEAIIGRMTNYLQHHEINIKLSQLFDTTAILQYISGEVKQNRLVAVSRKKDDKTYMVAISLMFGKLLTVLGIGSIGALAMKALGVASMALLMTGMMGLKNLHQSNEETSHHVQYVSDNHRRLRRRRRQILVPPPYPTAWKMAPVQ